MMRRTAAVVWLAAIGMMVGAFTPGTALASRWEVRQEAREGYREVGREKREARREIRQEVREDYYDRYFHGNDRWYRDGRYWNRYDYQNRYYRRGGDDDFLKGVVVGAAVIGVAAGIANSNDY
jgi:hypothetical protein